MSCVMAEFPERSARDADRLIYAGLLGLAVAGALQQFDKSEHATPQVIAVYAFALAIPLLAVGLVTDYARRAGTLVPGWHNLIGALGALSAVVGLGALFFHFGIGEGAVFVVGSVLGIALIRRL